MKRRQFLQSASLLTAAGLISPQSLLAEKSGVKKIGVQLFSLPRLLEKDFRSAIQLIAQIGYREVELFGPYPFSATETKESWKTVTSQLGFSGSGYFGLGEKKVKEVLNENKITVPSVHTDLVTMQKHMPELGKAGDALGFKYIGLPAIPPPLRTNLDSYKKMADEFNRIGEQAKKEGLRFTYHNHGYGLKEIDGQIPLNMIMERTDPKLVFFEMDIFWTVAGGADPVSYLKSYPNRYHLMHLKDMKEKKQFSGDGGDPRQWIELFPYMTTAGDGALNLKDIAKAAQEAGVKHFFVEQDMVADPEVALKRSFDYLKGITE